MKIIGLDTSTETGGVALFERGRLVAEYTLSLRRTTHSERLLPVVRTVLHDAGWLEPSAQKASPGGQAPVDGIAVALGPGSFTGLRIGVVTAKALAYAWHVPVAGISTLDALAFQAGGSTGVVCALLDARHGNVYSAVYDMHPLEPVPLLAPGLRAAGELFDRLPGELADAGYADATVVFTGDALDVYWDAIQSKLGNRAVKVAPTYEQLRSGAVAALGAARLERGEGDDVMQLVPLYLRKSEAERKWALHANKRSLS